MKFKRAKETSKTFRPCLVISNDIQNEFNDLIAVAPITTDDIKTVEPFEVYIENTSETGLNYPTKFSLFSPWLLTRNYV